MTASGSARLLLVAAVAALTGGCGPPTAAVTGAVTDAGGRPVTGLILFTPQDPAKYREAAEGKVVDGRYDLSPVSVGPKFVSLVITRDGGRSVDATPAPSTVDLVPGPQAIDFSLPKAKAKETPGAN